LNGVPFEVVGIVPSSFTGIEPPLRPAFYVPAAMAPQLDAARADLLEDRNARLFEVKGRLRSGASIRSARAELQTIWSGLAAQFPKADGPLAIAVRTELDTRIQSDPWDAAITAILMALAAVVLVIACANVASLLLGRGRARSREIAIRLALGVSRARLLRQLFTESLLLAALGCAGGVAVAYVGIRFLQQLPANDQVVIVPRLDLRVVLFTAIAAAVSACLFGLGPARQSLVPDLVPSLKPAESADMKRRGARGRSVLVVAQIAMAMVLLVATGVLLDGFRQSLALDPGFRTNHALMVSLNPALVRYTPAQAKTFYRALVARAEALPGVRAVALTTAVPFETGSQEMVSVVPENGGLPKGQDSVSTFNATVDDKYFDVMHIPIARGRAFADTDDARAPRSSS
jgi:predicted permease